MGLLSWLVNRAAKLYQWFGGFYSTAYSRVKNFYTWLKYYRDQAYEWGKSWSLEKILSYYYTAKVFVAYKHQQALNWINNTADRLSVFLSGKIQVVKTSLGFTHNKSIAEDVSINTKIDGINKRLGLVSQTWIERLISKILSPVSWVIGYKELIQDLKLLFEPENKIRFSILIKDLFGFLVQLTLHPIDTIIGIIQPVFLDLLSFSIAYALGTEKYELPDFPSWGNWYGGQYDYVLPPEAKRELSNPLMKLRISGYRFRRPPTHMGLDLGLNNGTPVFAMHSGTVEYTNTSMAGYGYQVTVGGGKWWTRYAHLERILVQKGQHVSKGQKIGLGDNTGNSSGSHLHLEIKFRGSFIDPELVLF